MIDEKDSEKWPLMIGLRDVLWVEKTSGKIDVRRVCYAYGDN